MCRLLLIVRRDEVMLVLRNLCSLCRISAVAPSSQRSTDLELIFQSSPNFIVETDGVTRLIRISPETMAEKIPACEQPRPTLNLAVSDSDEYSKNLREALVAFFEVVKGSESFTRHLG